MPGLLDNAVHIRPMSAFRTLLVAVLLALAPRGSTATLKAKLSNDAHLAAGDGQDAISRAAGSLQVGEATVAENVEFLTKTLSRFRSFAQTAQQSVQERHQDEEKRLEEAAAHAKDSKVRTLLQQSVESNKESLDETKSIYSNIVTFSGSMLSLLKRTSPSGYSCDQLTCGVHASCAETLNGASCVCDEGYIGKGKDCKAPPTFAPHLLVGENVVRARDMHVAALDSNKIAVVFRDENKANAGALVIGTVDEAGKLELSPLEFFTESGGQAFSPVVAGTDDRRLAIAWRDGAKSGTCRLRAALLGASGIRGAEMALTWGPMMDFCSEQAHKMSIQPFDKSRFVVLYSDKGRGSGGRLESFGNSLLADVGESGNVSVLGNFRFTDSAVARLEATKVNKNGFVLAARASQALDEMNPQTVKQEAMAMYGELVGEDLVFDPNPVNLEPTDGKIWARGVSLIAPHTLAYAYQDGTNLQMKVSVIDIDPQTHRMKAKHAPVALSKGFSPYVSMMSLPYSSSDPYTLTYYQGDGGGSVLNICGLNDAGKLANCEDFPWLSEKASSVSGASLGEGRVLMVFATPSGIPYYSLFGLSKK